MAVSLPIPRGVRREDHANLVFLRWEWSEEKNIPILVLFALVWNGLMAFLLYQEGFWPAEFSVAELFPRLFVVIGAFLAYSSAGALLNTTEMEIRPDLLRVTTGPVPWHREIRLEPAGIRDVIYRERAAKGYDSTYDVVVVCSTGEEKRLLRGLLRYEVAVYYVRELRAALNLPDTTLSPEA